MVEGGRWKNEESGRVYRWDEEINDALIVDAEYVNDLEAQLAEAQRERNDVKFYRDFAQQKWNECSEAISKNIETIAALVSRAEAAEKREQALRDALETAKAGLNAVVDATKTGEPAWEIAELTLSDISEIGEAKPITPEEVKD